MGHRINRAIPDRVKLLAIGFAQGSRLGTQFKGPPIETDLLSIFFGDSIQDRLFEIAERADIIAPDVDSNSRLFHGAPTGASSRRLAPTRLQFQCWFHRRLALSAREAGLQPLNERGL